MSIKKKTEDRRQNKKKKTLWLNAGEDMEETDTGKAKGGTEKHKKQYWIAKRISICTWHGVRRHCSGTEAARL